MRDMFSLPGHQALKPSSARLLCLAAASSLAIALFASSHHLIDGRAARIVDLSSSVTSATKPIAALSLQQRARINGFAKASRFQSEFAPVLRRRLDSSLTTPRVSPSEIDFSDANVQAAAAAAGTAILGGLAVFLAKAQEKGLGGDTGSTLSSRGIAAEKIRVQNAVGVFGATGKTGREVVNLMLSEGRDVVAFARDTKKAAELFAKAAAAGGGRLVTRQTDVTDLDKIIASSKELMDGVEQLVVALGPVYGKQPDGSFGPVDGLTPEKVDFEGVSNIAKLAGSTMKKPSKEDVSSVKLVKMSEGGMWTTIDDTIMGGKSKSSIEIADDVLKWSGGVITEGGGFCGLRTKDFANKTVSLNDFDGIRLRVLGDGNRYKFTVALRDGYTRYQHPFDTAAGLVQEIDLKFDDFVPLQTSNANFVDYAATPLSQADRSDVAFMNIVVSKFEFNGYPNPTAIPSQFALSVESVEGLSLPKPQVVMVTSASCERNARLVNKEQRAADIPIVQLNPNGILNWKYKGEFAIRSSGLSYTIVRPCGLTTQNETQAFSLDLSQGDTISGAISRKEVASLVAGALETHLASGKTFEARRSEAKDAIGDIAATTKPTISRQFQALVTDTNRHLAGLPVLAPPVDPPTEKLSEEEQNAVLNDPRVVSQRARERGAQQVAGRAEASFVVYRNGQPLASATASDAAAEKVGKGM